ncbi:MAG TPA: hypothetical protein PLZ57_05685 [Pseudobdellovibrionaceae bacterium]|nr:hypothetical protein [Pseudobdellovibrionaceae bacterium]
MVPQGKFRSALVLTLSVLAVQLGACSKQDSATPVTVGRDTRGIGPAGQPTAAGITLNGQVIADAQDQDSFQDAVTGMLEATMSPDAIGYVSATGANNTGVYIGGRVELSSGTLQTASSQRITVRNDSRLLVAVYDEYSSQNIDGKVVGPVTILLQNASGEVAGNQAILRFQDQHGYIEMHGTFNNSVFEGSFSYDNARRFDGSTPGAAGTVGWFRVPTCQFFRCQ